MASCGVIWADKLKPAIIITDRNVSIFLLNCFKYIVFIVLYIVAKIAKKLGKVHADQSFCRCWNSLEFFQIGKKIQVGRKVQNSKNIFVLFLDGIRRWYREGADAILFKING